MRERRAEWIAHRRQLLLEIRDATRRIRRIYGDLTALVNGRVREIDFQTVNGLREFKSILIDELRKTNALRNSTILSTLETAGNLASQAAKAVDIAMFPAEVNNAVFQGVSIAISTKGFASKIALQLSQRRFSNGFRLSDSIWGSDKIIANRVFSTIESSIQYGKSIRETVKVLSGIKRDEVGQKLPKYLKEIENLARRAAGGLPVAGKRYSEMAAQLRKDLERRAVREFKRPARRGLGILGTRQQTQLFLDRLDNAIAKQSTDLVSEAISEKLQKAAEYNAIRALRTLNRKAFEDTAKAERKERKWVIGERYNLSASHPRYDECDLRATVDLGMGAGVYPVGQSPDDHPNGLCFVTDVIDDKFFKRGGVAAKPKFSDGIDSIIGELQPGGRLAKTATAMGAAQNAGRVASEIKNLGISASGSKADKQGYKTFTFDEVRRVADSR